MQPFPRQYLARTRPRMTTGSWNRKSRIQLRQPRRPSAASQPVLPAQAPHACPHRHPHAARHLHHSLPLHAAAPRPALPHHRQRLRLCRLLLLISGFVLTYNYADRATTLSKREFWLARFSRLYPVYLLVLVISASMLRDEWYARPHEEFWRGVILTPLLLQGWSPNLATFGNTVAWPSPPRSCSTSPSRFSSTTAPPA